MTKVRFAPSPTGMMHVGNARTALITWLFARKNDGHFLLRIDDTDQERSKVEYENAIEESLTWLGLDWDSKANQKDRMDIYTTKIDELKASGRIYPCYETPEELSLKRKSQLSAGKPPIYDRAALELSDDDIAKLEAEGRKPHWRFKLEHTPIEWNDHIRGPVKFEGADLSDPVVIRETGLPLYHLCSVIDDIDFEITHVVRGEDHVSNTATHVQMFEALGATPPEFSHNALIAGKDGGKLSKRLGSLSILDLRDDEGLEAMAISSLMARLGTSDPIEAFTSLDPLIESFEFSKFSRAAAKFDPDEILRLNTKILHETPYEDVKDRLDGVDEELWIAVRGNIEKLSDVHDMVKIIKGPIEPVIEEPDYIAEALSALPDTWDEGTWSAWTSTLKEQTGRKGKALFMPLRQALTGMSHGPEMDKMLMLIGPEEARARLSMKKAA